MKKIITILITLLLITPTVNAKEIDHFTSKVDTEITLEDTYNSSLAVAGEDITFDGIVKGITFGASNKIQYNGTSQYTILAGNVVEINGTTQNDLFIAGNIITTTKNANINRDAIIAGEDIEINGTFNRNISIYASKVTIKNTTIKGNIKIYSANIEIEPNATIIGTLSYPEDSKCQISKEANIGKTVKTEAIQQENDDNFASTISAKIWSFLCLILIFAAITLLLPKTFNKIQNKYEKNQFNEIIETFTKGLIAIIIIPIIIVLLFCTMIGIPLAIITLLLYGIAIYTSSIFTAYLIGYKIWQKVFNQDINILGIGLIGLFILFLCSLIPGIRTLVSILTTIIGLGLIIETIKK